MKVFFLFLINMYWKDGEERVIIYKIILMLFYMCVVFKSLLSVFILVIGFLNKVVG